jgi:hypothetical protein
MKRLNIKAALDAFKLIGYALLLFIDEGITVLAMWSVGHSLPEKIGLSAFGFIIVLLGAWVFLSGIRAKGPERYIKIGAWVLSVVLVVAVNWSFTRTMLRTQSSEIANEEQQTTMSAATKQRQIDLALKNIEVYTSKLDKLNQWQEKERTAITAAIDKENDKIDKLSEVAAIVHKSESVQSMNIFRKMSEHIGGDQDLTADLWWLLAFVVAQVLTVLAAPKTDAPVPKRRRRRRPARAKAPEEASAQPEFEWDEFPD